MTNTLSGFIEKFRRVTSGGSYLPEIDGLRFVAIFWVVAWMHLPVIMDQHLFNHTLLNGYAAAVSLEGGQGVALFFMISGFILALPFIKEKSGKGPQVSIKRYYLRRLTRLEPPYLAALLLCFTAMIVFNNASVREQLPHLGASAVYLHNVIYNGSSSVLGVAWSLELEVQFYILAPFLCFIFLLRNNVVRRLLLVALIAGFAWYGWSSVWRQPVLLPNFLAYFLAGMFLADLHTNGHKPFFTGTIGTIAGLLIIIGLPFLISVASIGFYALKMLLLFCGFYLVLFNSGLRKIFSRQWTTIIGGMCYSIYLLHVLILSGGVRVLEKLSLPRGPFAVMGFAIILLAAVLIICVLFFKLIEQPFMRLGRRRPVASAKK